jgi:hypothetical protein
MEAVEREQSARNPGGRRKAAADELRQLHQRQLFAARQSGRVYNQNGRTAQGNFGRPAGRQPVGQYKERATLRRKGAENELLLLDGRVGDIDLELTERRVPPGRPGRRQRGAANYRRPAGRAGKAAGTVAAGGNGRQTAKTTYPQFSHNIARAGQTLDGRRQTLSQREKERAAHQACSTRSGHRRRLRRLADGEAARTGVAGQSRPI